LSESLEAIQRVVAAFERSDWSEIDIRSGGIRVHLAADAPTDSGSPALRSSGPREPGRATPAHDRFDEDCGGPGAGHPTSSPVPDPPPGALVVVSPSPGIFWRSPEPGAPPFVDVGDTVEASATVCIIEVMKLMNHLKAGIDGVVVEVYLDDGVAVGKGEPLFAITPSESA